MTLTLTIRVADRPLASDTITDAVNDTLNALVAEGYVDDADDEGWIWARGAS